MTELELREAYRIAFGSPIEFTERNTQLPDQASADRSTRNGARSALGAPLWATDYIGRQMFLPVKLGGVQLPLPLIRINGRKNIVETTLVNRRGTVKELISLDDYRISIRGIMHNGEGTWPEAMITDLRNLYERNEALDIECALTAIFLQADEKVVITNLDILETRGSQTLVPYQIDLVTDSEFTLIYS